MKKNLFFFILLALISISIFSCKDSSTDSQPNYKSPNEMTWTVDTIYSPDPTSIQVIPENLLVFSPSDAWLVCWNEVARGLLWHYDGTNWIESNIFADVGGMRVYDLAGSSSHDLWTGGYSGGNIFLAHYDGAHWKASSNMGITGGILDMCIDPSGNIWACGRNGIILKYSEKKWNVDTLIVPHYKEGSYFLNSIAYYKNKAFVISRIVDSNKKRDLYYYANGDIGNWKIEDSVIVDQPSVDLKWGQWKLYSSSFGKLYSVGPLGIWQYNGQSWNKSYSTLSKIYSICGPSEKYLIAVGDFGEVLYYDGGSWQNILNLLKVGSTDFIFTNVWTNGSETFIAGYGTIDGVEKTIIWHGK